jgi:hypothetical protein
MVAPTGASTAFPLPKMDTFEALFQDRANDPYGGEYAASMVYLNEDSPIQGVQALYDLVVSSLPNMGILLGIFEEPNHEGGHSLALHGINVFGAILGRPSKWDSQDFIFVNDVVGGQAQTVELLPTNLEQHLHAYPPHHCQREPCMDKPSN